MVVSLGSVRNFVILYSVAFVLLVVSLNDFDILYFSFVFMGRLMVINFLILVGDIGNVGVLLVLILVIVPYYFVPIMSEYLFLLFVLFVVLFL